MSSYYNRPAPSRSLRASRGSATSSRTPIASSTKTIPTETSQEILRTLLKQPSNRHCADCKTATHPRWASWSLGIFICIRCSGIHRSMGTHISRVKSVDLDDWTQDQIESMIAWGNGKANQYWEAKLPDNYRPDESKIDNYIRTKYDLKRWVASAQIPDPKTLKGDAAASDKAPVISTPSAKLDMAGSKSRPVVGSSHAQGQSHNNVPAPQKAPPSPVKKAPQADLLSLDFNNNASPSASASAASASATVSNAQSSRPDLKKSILSLYSSPRPQQPAPRNDFNFFDVAAPAASTPAAPITTSNSIIDPFSSLSLSNNTGFFNNTSSSSYSKPITSNSTFSTPTYPSANTTTAHHQASFNYNSPSNNINSTNNDDDDEWSVFTSGSSPVVGSSNPSAGLGAPVKPADDMFANVWN
ncbi:ArfGap-domain-containing protein [Nadsonia fulvescens var. elongata DSM 6958]|uniref:ArfGap-domain-containing protein n=1 Tax=Nadsonia fulvescens var. elongata DSM 6958 TaxID=857566 RepID=A0A1E3PIL9_9ASCO|nr:ArfGap-domain-containing protein [Nadsonia fulvescens var. elongata DSM 6958]